MELNTTHSTVQVKNAWSYISAPHCAFVACFWSSTGAVLESRRSRLVFVLNYFQDKE